MRHGTTAAPGSGDRLLAGLGLAVRSWVSYFGLCLNINPVLEPYRLVRCSPRSELPMTSLERERRGRRASVAGARAVRRTLSARALGSARVSLFTEHRITDRQFGTVHAAASGLRHVNLGANTLTTARLAACRCLTQPQQRRLPAWLKRPLPEGNENFFTHNLLRELDLETVCENARCPNRPECYARRTATFMIMGNVCTRPCGFCSVPRGDAGRIGRRRAGTRRRGVLSAGPQARRHHLA